MPEAINLDQLLEQRERLAASIQEKKREAGERRREADQGKREAGRLGDELKDLERQITRAKLEQAEKPAGHWARLRFGVRSYAEMRRQVRELRAENERLRGYESKVKTAGSVAGRLVAGSELRKAARAWIGEARSGRLFGDELADFGAAVIRRVVRVGLIGAVVAALPMILLGWQNILMREQNTTIQEQLKDQREDTLIVRRAQLLDTIYEQVCEVAEDADTDESGEKSESQASPKTREVCKPKAHARARREAAQALVKIEKMAGNRVDLQNAQIPGADLTDSDLIDARLTGANLAHDRGVPIRIADSTVYTATPADLSGTNLTRANLGYAKVASANLSAANLTRANLGAADLSNANFTDADLTFASLRGAKLHSAKLHGAKLRHANLTDADLYGADLTDADLGGANLTRADLARANLAGAFLGGADLRGHGDALIGATIIGTEVIYRIAQAQINSARGNEHTKLPDYLTMPDHWKSDKPENSADQ